MLQKPPWIWFHRGMLRQKPTCFLLVIEICLILLSGIARAGETIYQYKFWPHHNVNFSVVTPENGESRLTINGPNPETLAEGVIRLIPNIPEQSADDVAPLARRTELLNLDYQWQVVVVDQTPFVLNERGRAIRLRDLPDDTVPRVQPLKDGIALGYMNEGGRYMAIVVTREHVYAVEDFQAKTLDDALAKISLETLTVETGYNKISLEDHDQGDLQVFAISSKGNYLVKAAVNNWSRRWREAALNDLAMPTHPIAASFGGQTMQAGTTQTTSDKKNPVDPKSSKQQKPKPTKEPELTGVALLRQELAEKSRLLTHWKSQVFDQDYALERTVHQVSTLIKSDGSAPTVLIYGGGSGGGKSYTARLVGESYSPGAVFPIFGNEYSAHSGSLDHHRLLSSHKSDGPLVLHAKAHPDKMTVVIDEADKMHVDIWAKLMEFIRTGTLTDSQGKLVSSKHVLIIMTSNRGALRMFPPQMKDRSRDELDERARSFSQEELKAHYTTKEGLTDANALPIEVMNRVTEIIPFIPTTLAAAIHMAKATAADQNEFYEKKYHLRFEFGDKVVDRMAEEAWKAGSNGHTISLEIRSMMSAMHDQAPEKLAVENHQVIGVEMDENPFDQPRLRASANGRSFTIPIGLPFKRSELRDLEKRKLYRELDTEMNKHVIGQSQTIDDVVNGVISRIGKDTGKPFFALLLGPSGIGKSAISRALAVVRYKDPNRVSTLPMGEIADDQRYDAAFGVAGQMQGGDIERPFEKILRENPDGCVINLGEFSNMGGGDPTKKGALSMRFYNLVEEGVYTSPRDGRKFDLTKYIFVADGNDLQNVFLGITDDDMLMERYREVNNPDTKREMLLAAGFPNAFLNRIDLISLLKPLLRAEVLAVASKIWVNETRVVQSQIPEGALEPTPELLEQLSRSFFSAAKGARSVESVIKNQVVGMLNSVLMSKELDDLNFSNIKLRINLTDSATRKTYHHRSIPRLVEFSIELERDGKVIASRKLNVTDKAPKLITLNPDDAKSLSGHESGHAVGNIPGLTNENFRYVTIRAGSIGALKYLGYAGSERVPGTEGRNMTRRELIGHLRALYSGRIAQEFLGYPPDRGWGNDLEKMRELVTDHLVKYGLEPGFEGLPLDRSGKPIVDTNYLTHVVSQILEEARTEAAEHLRSKWPLVRSIMAELLRKGHMDAKRRNEIVAAYERGELASVRNKDRYGKQPTPYRPEGLTCRAFGFLAGRPEKKY